jgi:hypothetical protein
VNILPPSSGSKSKRGKKRAEKGCKPDYKSLNYRTQYSSDLDICTKTRIQLAVFSELNAQRSSKQSQSHIATDGQSVSQSVSLGVEPHLGLMTRYLLLFDSYGFVSVGRPL